MKDQALPALNGPSKPGFVLLVVIAVFVLVITLLGQLARISMDRSLAAADSEIALRGRWANRSLESVLLSRAAKRFDELEQQAAKTGTLPQSVLRDRLVLGGIAYDLLLADEGAKANVDAIYHMAGRDGATRMLSETLPLAFGPAIALSPATKPQQFESTGPTSKLRRGNQLNEDDEDAGDEPTEVPRAFRSWGEVFRLPLLREMPDPIDLPTATLSVTLFGNGQLNLKRASDQAILSTLSPVIQKSAAQRVLSRFRDNPRIAGEVLLLNE
ncbi:MAG: hypothetical protein AAGA03_07245, partial [Planctomycetota bacterium]